MIRTFAAVSLFALAACQPAGQPVAAAPESAPEQAGAAAPLDEANPPALVELSFRVAGSRLNGHAYLANGAGPHPTVVLLHGFPGNERNLDLAQDLRSNGFNVLFFHYRGAWGSEGVYSLPNLIEDIGGAVAYLRENFVELRTDPQRILLVGHSMGGFGALQAAARDPSITCVGAMAPADMAGAAERFADPQAAADFAAYADDQQMLAGLDGKALVADIRANRDAYDLALLAPKMVGKSILIVLADKDGLTPRAMAVAAAYKAQDGVKLSGVELSGDHSFSWSRRELSDTVVDWAKSCAR